MDYLKQILTIAIFSCYTFIFSIFILPGVKKLKDIQNKLKGIITPKSLQESHDEILNKKNQSRELTLLFSEYKLEYQEVSMLMAILKIGLRITIYISLAYFIITFPFLVPYKSSDLNNSLLIVYLVSMIYLILIAFKKYIPEPTTITEWSYLVKRFNISPSGLGQIADLRIDLNKSRDSTKRPIRLESNIELRGYKYWFFLYNPEEKDFKLIICGNINKNIELLESFKDIEDFDGRHTTLDIDISKLQDQSLNGYFFVFDPNDLDKEGHPYRGTNRFSLDASTLSTGYTIHLNASPYGKIIYTGLGLSFNEIEYKDGHISHEDDNIIKTALGYSKNKIKNTKKHYEIIQSRL